MATMVFTQNLRRHVNVERVRVCGNTVAKGVADACRQHPPLRGYLLDDTGGLRKHVVMLVDGRAVADRRNLSDELPDTARLFVMQALSGG